MFGTMWYPDLELMLTMLVAQLSTELHCAVTAEVLRLLTL